MKSKYPLKLKVVLIPVDENPSNNVMLFFITQLQHQKLINSWSVEQRDEVTSAAVYNPVDKTILMAVNKTV